MLIFPNPLGVFKKTKAFHEIWLCNTALISNFSKLPRSGSVVRIKPGQLLVIDVYTEWSGPCSAVESHLRRLRHSYVEAPDTLALARACCDKITDLQAFKQ